MTQDKPRHLRHDTGATVTRRSVMVAGFFLGVLTYFSGSLALDLQAGYDPAAAQNLPPTPKDVLVAMYEGAQLNFTIAMTGFIFYSGLLVASWWRAAESAILGFSVWLIARSTMYVIGYSRNEWFWMFLMLDLFILGALWRGWQAVRPRRRAIEAAQEG